MEPAAASPTETNSDRYQLPAVRVEQGPVIDGVLDDQVWAQAALIDESGDDDEAVAIAASLVRDAGFDPVIVGPLARASEFDRGSAVR